MEARKFLALAQELAGRVDEAASRSAVSRAYYAVLHAAAIGCARSGAPVPKNERFHASVAETVAGILPGLREDLERLREARNYADYDIRDPWDVDDARWRVRKAARMLESLEERFRE